MWLPLQVLVVYTSLKYTSMCIFSFEESSFPPSGAPGYCAGLLLRCAAPVCCSRLPEVRAGYTISARHTPRLHCCFVCRESAVLHPCAIIGFGGRGIFCCALVFIFLLPRSVSCATAWLSASFACEQIVYSSLADFLLRRALLSIIETQKSPC